MIRKVLLLSILCIIFHCSAFMAMQRDNHRKSNLLFIMWALFQGNFKKIPKDVRKEILAKNMLQQALRCKAFINQVHTVKLSLADIFFCNQRQIDGIEVLNSVRAGNIYGQHWKLSTPQYISWEDYRKACKVPAHIKHKFKEGNSTWDNKFPNFPVLVGLPDEAQEKTISL